MCPNCTTMRYLLLSSLLALGPTASSQIPDYVPTDGLVAYYPFNGNPNDVSGNNHHAENDGAVLVQDRFGESSAAYSFGGAERIVAPNSVSPVGSEARTINVHFVSYTELPIGNNTYSLQGLFGSGSPFSGKVISTLNIDGQGTNNGHLPRPGHVYFSSGSWYDEAWSEESVSDSMWHMATMVYSGPNTAVQVFVDGQFQDETEPITLNTHLSAFYIGDVPWAALFFNGIIDDVGVWDRPLGEEEILGLYLADAPNYGCTNEEACNFNPEANVDDGLCAELDSCGECGGDGVAGCTDVNACNYNPIASCDDGSCIYPPVIDLGEDIETCDGPVVLQAGPGFDGYLWSTGESNDSIEVTVSGLYGVSVSVEDQAWLLESTSGAVVSTSNVNLDTSDFTFSVDVKADMGQLGPYSGIFRNYSGAADLVNGYYLRFESGKLNFDLNNFGQPVQHPNGGNVIFLESPQVVADGNWHNAIVTYDSESWTAKLFVDGLLADTQLIGSPVVSSFNENPLIFGTDEFNGEIDNFAFWSTVVGEEDILEIANCGPLEANTTPTLFFHADGSDAQADLSEEVQLVGRQTANGCQMACSATDSILVVLNHGSCFCGQGSVWQEETQECVPVVTVENACLDGTVWNEELGGCVVATPSDTDFDGCVSMTDLLDLLSVFGTCNEIPWSCGDPLEYQGYDYATVQIGEQCWFAENLRSENYLNGDAILTSLSGDEWSTVNVGAVSTFGEGESNCYNYSPNGDACNETWALSEYGRLYNWHATVDDRGLCPTDWHVSSDSDWLLLMEFL